MGRWMLASYNEMEEERLKKIRKEWNEIIKNCKTSFKTPIFTNEVVNMYEAFEMMHKADGTIDGRRKCDFAL